MSPQNMYRVGDYVYFENSASAPYLIRKIEEIFKTTTGAVEAKVVSFYRRKDIPENLIQLADQDQTISGENISETQLSDLKNRELFLSRHLETLPATQIRGKCNVSLYCTTDDCSKYLDNEDTFFFQLVYDPIQKTLQKDKASIRIGENYQANIIDNESENGYKDVVWEECLWKPCETLLENDFKTFSILFRSVATLGRAYHPPSALRQPSLVMSAAAASRDSTLQYALDVLFRHNFDTMKALQSIISNGQPVLKFDEMEEWSASEGNLFEEALEKYGKRFQDIHSDFLPWKTTEQKRMKAHEAEHKLKQVYIPNYNKPNTSILHPSTSTEKKSITSICDCCMKSQNCQWYGLCLRDDTLLKICPACWIYRKKYGVLKSDIINVVSQDKDLTLNNGKTFQSEQLEKAHLTSLQSKDILSVSTVADPSMSKFATVLKNRGSITFQFQSNLALRIIRHKFPYKFVKKQARQPLNDLDTYESLLDEAKHFSDLTKKEIKEICAEQALRIKLSRFGNTDSSTTSMSNNVAIKNGRRERLSTVIDKIKSGASIKLEFNPDIEEIFSIKGNGDLSICMNFSNTENKNIGDTLKRNIVNSHDEVVCKKANLEELDDFHKNRSTKRPQCRSPGETLCFLATNQIKQNRRTLSPQQLHRLCRMPFQSCAKTLLENCSENRLSVPND